MAASPAARFSSRPVSCQKNARIRAIESRGPSARGRTPGSRTRSALPAALRRELVDPGVDAGREAVECLGLLVVQGGELLVREDAEPEQPIAAVQAAAAGPSTSASRPSAATVVVDLPEPILRQREAVPDEQVTGRLGVDVCGAGGIADDPDRPLDVAAQGQAGGRELRGEEGVAGGVDGCLGDARPRERPRCALASAGTPSRRSARSHPAHSVRCLPPSSSPRVCLAARLAGSAALGVLPSGSSRLSAAGAVLRAPPQECGDRLQVQCTLTWAASLRARAA